MTPPLTPSSLSAALAQIALERWGAKGSIVSAIRLATLEDPTILPGGWAYVSGRVLADFTGLDRWHTFRRLGELVDDDRVILQRAKGRGSRPGEYRINPAFDQWRNVPWRVDRGQAVATVARVLLGAGARQEQALAARHSAHLEPFASRAGSALNPASGAFRRDTSGVLAARPGSALIAGNGASHLSPVRDKSLPHDDEDEPITESPTATAVIGAYWRTTGTALWGQPRRAVIAACNGTSDPGPLIAAIERAGPGLGPRGVAEVVTAAASTHPAATREQLLKRRAVLLSYVENDVADEDHLAELAGCDNALAGMDGGHA